MCLEDVDILFSFVLIRTAAWNSLWSWSDDEYTLGAETSRWLDEYNDNDSFSRGSYFFYWISHEKLIVVCCIFWPKLRMCVACELFRMSQSHHI